TYDLSLNDVISLGKAGTPGKDGVDGKIGLNGKDGTSAEIRTGQGKAGVDGKDGETTTRIIYKDKDGTDHEVATLDDGLKFKGDNDDVVIRKLNSQLDIKGGAAAADLSDNNIGVVGTAGDQGGMAVKLSKKLKGLTSAEFKDGDNVTNITAGDVTVTKKEGNETKTLSIWELNKTVNNITAGTTDVSSWKLQANGKDERIIKKNSVVNFTNGTATEVTVHENNITVDLNKATKEKIDKIDNIDGRVTTIENNIKNIDQKIEGAKITVEGDTTTGVKAEEVKDKNDKVKGYKVSLDKQVKVGNVAIDGKDSKGEITGLTNTTVDATDFATKGRAATEEQLKAAMGKVQAQGRTTVKGSGNITVTPGTTGAAEYTVGLADNISVDSVTANEYKVGDKTYINKDGINANGNKITNVADGKVSVDSKDAVNGSQLFGVEQKVNQNISILGGKVSELDGRVNRVGAGAAALAALHPLDFDPDDKWDFAAGYGNYSGANAVAIGAYYRPNEDTMFSVGGSFGGGENMVNAGVSVKLGQGNHVSTSRVAMAKDMLDMQQRMAEMEAQMAKLQGFIGALTGADAQAAMFPDVPENHWAYEYVNGLREQGIIEGYPDGNFAGDRSMTRYEFAAMLYRALAKGVSLDARAVQEFAPELARIRVDVVSKDKEGQPVIERVRVNEEQQAK
ncbi:MAG: S-layer homology domain-containing protein, partial [Negativicoccus succinicivorans]|uniref:S-layer homology domain-containing protein n=1 Tax=Negativicoccus succinicivorans TaxID=620903 RepID=UPI00290BBDB6